MEVFPFEDHCGLQQPSTGQKRRRCSDLKGNLFYLILFDIWFFQWLILLLLDYEIPKIFAMHDSSKSNSFGMRMEII